MYIFIWPKSDIETFEFCSKFEMSECKFIWVRFKRVRIIHKAANFIQKLYTALKAVSTAKPGDIIITFNFEQGVYIHMVQRIARKGKGGGCWQPT